MNKIIIEITPEGWETTVKIGGQEFKQKYSAEENRTTEGDFENENNIPEVVYDALNNMFPYDCMEALQEIEY